MSALSPWLRAGYICTQHARTQDVYICSRTLSKAVSELVCCTIEWFHLSLRVIVTFQWAMLPWSHIELHSIFAKTNQSHATVTQSAVRSHTSSVNSNRNQRFAISAGRAFHSNKSVHLLSPNLHKFLWIFLTGSFLPNSNICRWNIMDQLFIWHISEAPIRNQDTTNQNNFNLYIWARLRNFHFRIHSKYFVSLKCENKNDFASNPLGFSRTLWKKNDRKASVRRFLKENLVFSKNLKYDYSLRISYVHAYSHLRKQLNQVNGVRKRHVSFQLSRTLFRVLHQQFQQALGQVAAHGRPEKTTGPLLGRSTNRVIDHSQQEGINRKLGPGTLSTGDNVT